MVTNLERLNKEKNATSKAGYILLLLKSINKEITSNFRLSADDRYDIVWICALIEKIKAGIDDKILARVFAAEAVRLMVSNFEKEGYPNCSLQLANKRNFDSGLFNFIANAPTERLKLRDIQNFASSVLFVTFKEEPEKVRFKPSQYSTTIELIYDELKLFYIKERLQSKNIGSWVPTMPSSETGNDADNAVIEEGEGEEKEQKPVDTEATGTPAKLDNLKDRLTKAAQSYITWVEANRFVGFKELFNKKPANPETSGGRFFSAFRHGKTGIKRANNLIKRIEAVQDEKQLISVLAEHFSIDGPVHNHSLNTYLVKVIKKHYELSVNANTTVGRLSVMIGTIEMDKKNKAEADKAEVAQSSSSNTTLGS